MSRDVSRLLRLLPATVLGCALIAVSACGSRGPLDADPLPDAAVAVDAGAVDDAAGDATATVDAAPIADAGREGGSIIGCGTCLVDECSQGIIQCAQDAACRQIFQCVVTDCLAGGGSPSPACLFGCADGDIAGALKIFEIFKCVTGTCGTDCGPLLGGLLGGGGGGGGTPDAGKTDAGPGKVPPPPPGGGAGGIGAAPVAASKRPLPPIAQAFSRWPELCEPLTRP